MLLRVSQLLRFHRKFSSKIRLKSNELSSVKIRNVFLEYFTTKHNHKFIRSSPVIPFCDPSVPFVNAGMNQFKNVFLGKATAACKAAANSQKCIRVGGKHNDLNVIGTDGYHHSFFEMLGSWSFGDYFKEKACKLAWDLLTNSYKIDPTRLYVTYFGGDSKLGLKPDSECKEIWLSIGVPDDRILPFGVKDNFWEMGTTGPCGTCSEIHIDHLPNSNAAQRAQFVNADYADLTELWNIVFIEYNRKSDGSLEPLKQKFIDTGMGFERLVAVLQGKCSNYDSDLFVPIFEAISKESGKDAYRGIYDPGETGYDLDYAYRLIADHTRMCAVCIADGMYPQTNHRLRKIMRKTMNVCERAFKKQNIIQNAIVPQIIESLALVYPELERNTKNICETFTQEAELYKSSIENNRKMFKLLKIPTTSELKEDDVIDFSNFSFAFKDIEKQLESDQTMQSLSTEYLFDKLYTSYGLNEDLIRKVAAEKRLHVNMIEFEHYKNMKKNEAKSVYQIENNTLYEKLLFVNVPETVYHYMYDYEFDIESRQFVLYTLKAKVALVERNENENLYHIILDETNFYHTAGGQDSDKGQIISSNGDCTFNVENVTLYKGFVIHTGHFSTDSKPFSPNENVKLVVNASRRTHLSQHHTAMHLLQAAMKKVTNQIIFQESSHISASNLKCKFGTIGKRITLEQLQNIEKLICEVIKARIPIETIHLSEHEFYALDNLTTVPGATYPDSGIRVLKVKDINHEFESIEPCCGTHANNTSELEDFCITSLRVYNNSSYDITAVAGELVQSIKLQERNILSNYETFKNRSFCGENSEDEWESIELDANQIKRKLFEGQISYITAAKIIAEMANIDKHIRTTKRAQIRKLMVSEMIDVLAKQTENKETFIVHVLRTKWPLDETLLVEAEQMCHDLPVILLNVSDNKIVHGRASIPLKYTDASFNANHWIQKVGDLFNIKCSPAKRKPHFIQSKLSAISNKIIEPMELENALRRTRELAAKMFSKLVFYDANDRLVKEHQLMRNISDIRSKINKVKSLDDVRKINLLVANIRTDLKMGFYSYDIKSKCTTELVDINDQIIEAQHEMEKKLFIPKFQNALSESLLNEKAYILHAINTENVLLSRTVMKISDLCTNLAMVLIIISNNDVTGRISIPFKYLNGNLTIQDLGDEFILRFDGKCIHNGARLNSSVIDFQLKGDLVNEKSLNEVFKSVESRLKTILFK